MQVTKLQNGQYQITNTVEITPVNGVPYSTITSEIVTKDVLNARLALQQSLVELTQRKIAAVDALN